MNFVHPVDARINNEDLLTMLSIAGISVEIFHLRYGTMFSLFKDDPKDPETTMMRIDLPLGATEMQWRAAITALVEANEV